MHTISSIQFLLYIQSKNLRKKCISTIMIHRYQNSLLKLTIFGSDLGQWQLHIIYNFIADLHKPEVINIDL